MLIIGRKRWTGASLSSWSIFFADHLRPNDRVIISSELFLVLAKWMWLCIARWIMEPGMMIYDRHWGGNYQCICDLYLQQWPIIQELLKSIKIKHQWPYEFYRGRSCSNTTVYPLSQLHCGELSEVIRKGKTRLNKNLPWWEMRNPA